MSPMSTRPLAYLYPQSEKDRGRAARPRRLVIKKMGVRELTAGGVFSTAFTPYWIHRQPKQFRMKTIPSGKIPIGNIPSRTRKIRK